MQSGTILCGMAAQQTSKAVSCGTKLTCMTFHMRPVRCTEAEGIH